tara:strand:+ start:207 stop:344 length:138 start_codon:yes stop_codon:yes gene_type:complete
MTCASVSAVPIPAALLFAPALLGFFGLRRKAAVALFFSKQGYKNL